MSAETRTRWRVCVPPSGPRYFFNLDSGETLWAPPPQIDASRIPIFSEADEEAVADSDLVPVEEVAAALTSASAHPGGDKVSGEPTPVICSHVSGVSASNAATPAARVSPQIVGLLRELVATEVAGAAGSTMLSPLWDVCREALQSLLLDAAPLSSPQLPIAPAFARGRCFPGVADLEEEHAWRVRRTASSGGGEGELYYANELSGETTWAAPEHYIDVEEAACPWPLLEGTAEACAAAGAGAAGSAANLARMLRALATEEQAAGVLPHLASCSAAWEQATRTPPHRAALAAAAVDAGAARASTRPTGAGLTELAAAIQSSDATQLHRSLLQLRAFTAATLGESDEASGGGASGWVPRVVASLTGSSPRGGLRERDFAGCRRLWSLHLESTSFSLPRCLRSLVRPALPSPTQLEAAETLVLLGRACHAAALELLLAGAPAGEEVPERVQPSGLAQLAAVVVRGLQAELTGPHTWALLAHRALGSSSGTDDIAASGVGAAGASAAPLTEPRWRAAVAAAFSARVAGDCADNAKRWLLLFSAVCQYLTRSAVQAAVASAMAIAASAAPHQREALSTRSRLCSVSEDSLPWAQVTLAFLASLNPPSADDVPGTDGGDFAAVEGAGARHRHSRSAASSISSLSGAADPLTPAVLQACVALHRMAEVAICGVQQGSHADADAGACSTAAPDLHAALGSLPEAFGLVTPVVEAFAGWIREAMEGAEGEAAARPGSPPPAAHLMLSSQLVASLAAPPPDGAWREIEAAGGAGLPRDADATDGQPLLDEDYLPLQAGAAAASVLRVQRALDAAQRAAAGDSCASDAAAAAASEPLPAFPHGQWRGQRLATVSFLCALLELRPSLDALFFSSDLRVLVDVVLQELSDLSVADCSRLAWLRLLKTLLLRSQWYEGSRTPASGGRAARGSGASDGQYRVSDVCAVLSAIFDPTASLASGLPACVREAAGQVLHACREVLQEP